MADYFEAAAGSVIATPPLDKLANWVTGEFFALLNQASRPFAEVPIPPTAMAELVDMVEVGTINATTGKEVLAQTLRNRPGTPEDRRGSAAWRNSTTWTSLRPIIRQVLRDNPDQVAQYTAGKSSLSQWFFGQVMRTTGGKANPQIVRSRTRAGATAS